MKTRQQSARGGFLAGNVKFIGSNKMAHTRLFQIRLYEGHRVKAHRRGLRDLPEEEFLRGLEWHTDVGSKSPRAEISDFVTTYNSYDAYRSTAEWSPGLPAASPTKTDAGKSTPATSRS